MFVAFPACMSVLEGTLCGGIGENILVVRQQVDIAVSQKLVNYGVGDVCE